LKCLKLAFREKKTRRQWRQRRKKKRHKFTSRRTRSRSFRVDFSLSFSEINKSKRNTPKRSFRHRHVYSARAFTRPRDKYLYRHILLDTSECFENVTKQNLYGFKTYQQLTVVFCTSTTTQRYDIGIEFETVMTRDFMA